MPRNSPAKSAQQEVDESSRLQSTTVHETIRQEGGAELERPLKSLWWSGIAPALRDDFEGTPGNPFRLPLEPHFEGHQR